MKLKLKRKFIGNERGYLLSAIEIINAHIRNGDLRIVKEYNTQFNRFPDKECLSHTVTTNAEECKGYLWKGD